MWTRTYTVHLRPASDRRPAEVVVLRDGFCLAAAIFSVLWALYHRLWFAAFMLLAFGIGLEFALETLEPDPLSEAALAIAAFLWIGFEAGDWRRAGLERRGYLPAAVIVAPDLTAAEQRFFSRAPLTAEA